MDKPKELQELINSVGAMAEMTALYQNELVDRGIPEEEVVAYTATFVAATLGGGKSGQN